MAPLDQLVSLDRVVAGGWGRGRGWEGGRGRGWGVGGSVIYVKPALNWANVCSPYILRTLRRTMIRFSTELLVRRRTTVIFIV